MVCVRVKSNYSDASWSWNAIVYIDKKRCRDDDPLNGEQQICGHKNKRTFVTTLYIHT